MVHYPDGAPQAPGPACAGRARGAGPAGGDDPAEQSGPAVTQALHLPSQVKLASRVIAVVSSAGGIAALGKMLAELPKDLPAAVLVVQH
ncbi:MAG: hypothetical protein E6J17_10475, partial [Chloroflexi bacterium]